MKVIQDSQSFVLYKCCSVVFKVVSHFSGRLSLFALFLSVCFSVLCCWLVDVPARHRPFILNAKTFFIRFQQHGSQAEELVQLPYGYMLHLKDAGFLETAFPPKQLLHSCKQVQIKPSRNSAIFPEAGLLLKQALYKLILCSTAFDGTCACRNHTAPSF